MFVFWYCHKRGKQVRLDRESAEGNKTGEEVEGEGKDDFDGSDFDATDSDGGDDDDIAQQIATAVKEDREIDDDEKAALKRKEDVLNPPEQPAQAPLPDTGKGDKGAGMEAEKSVGV